MSYPSNRRPQWGRIAGAVGYTCFLALALALGSAAGWLAQSGTAMVAVKQWALNQDPEDVFGKPGVTVLVLGCDEDRTPGGKKIVREYARSDMILVARLDFENHRIGGVSVPRDLEVALPGYRAQKINAYHSIGGKELAKRAVEYVLGIPIDRVVVINYKAFQEMVDLVGGVEVFIEKKLVYTDRRGDLYINLDAGRQHLNGYQAMGYVRMRHSDDDLHRMKRQREFLLAFKDAAVSRWDSAPRVIEKAAEVIGEGLTREELAALGNFVRRVKGDNIKMATIPVMPGEGYNLLINRTELPKVLEDQYLLPPTKFTSRVVAP